MPRRGRPRGLHPATCAPCASATGEGLTWFIASSMHDALIGSAAVCSLHSRCLSRLPPWKRSRTSQISLLVAHAPKKRTMCGCLSRDHKMHSLMRSAMFSCVGWCMILATASTSTPGARCTSHACTFVNEPSPISSPRMTCELSKVWSASRLILARAVLMSDSLEL